MAPQTPGVFDLTMVADERNVRYVRALVDHGSQKWCLPDAIRRNAQLVLTELVTNAVRLYEGSELRAWASNPIGSLACDVRVWDPDPSKGPVLLPPSEAAVFGRGMALVDALTKKRWGWNVTTEPLGKVVFGRVSL
jgi:hypothetical protein